MASVLIVGGGAIGGLLGALLVENGHDARLVVKPHHAVALRHGVRIEGGGYGAPREVAVPASADAPRAFAPDLVVLATKTQDLADAIPIARRAAPERAPVVVVQNGLAQDAMAREAFGAERAVAAIVALDAAMLEPGVVDVARRGTFLVGPATPAGDEAARVLADAVDVQRAADVDGARWTKLLINLANVVPAITGLPLQKTATHKRLAIAHVRLVKEGVRVARAEGVTPAPIPYTSPALVRALALLPDRLAAFAYAKRVERVLGDAEFYGSTWQSRQRGRALETEWLNGEVVRRGAKRGIPTPVNAAALALAAEGATLGPDEAAARLLGR